MDNEREAETEGVTRSLVKIRNKEIFNRLNIRIGIIDRKRLWTSESDEERTIPQNIIHSFIPAISIAPLQVLYHSEALPTTARILYQSFTPKRTGNCR